MRKGFRFDLTALGVVILLRNPLNYENSDLENDVSNWFSTQVECNLHRCGSVLFTQSGSFFCGFTKNTLANRGASTCRISTAIQKTKPS